MTYYSALRTVLDSGPSYGSLTLLNFWIIYPKGAALSPLGRGGTAKNRSFFSTGRASPPGLYLFAPSDPLFAFSHSTPHAAGSTRITWNVSVDFVELNLPSIGRYCIDPFPSVVASASPGREENEWSSLTFVLGVLCGQGAGVLKVL
uniref:Uncharacterized protein n=1 Tax=Treubia lacunosa TaxID=93845 RepID=G4Y9Q5_9MARC|nr:hypothetical protein TrlaMp06 [Treubia lacunosa]AEH99701.1 hypothetical protein TrlaMp06 [Treubia lacunosa]